MNRANLYSVERMCLGLWGIKIRKKALRVHIEDDDKVVNKMDTTYGIKPTTFVNKSGLYSPLYMTNRLRF